MKVLRDVVYIYEPRSFEDITALMAMLQHYSLKRPTILPRTYMLVNKLWKEVTIIFLLDLLVSG